MQNLTAAPRDSLTAAQVTSLLTAPALTVDYGCELLDASLNLVADISADVSGGTVKRDNYAAVHGTVDLTISRTLAWGRDRVRPFMVLSSSGLSARFNLGVYLMQTPSLPLAETPATFAVTGYDQLHLLQDSVGDSYSVAAGANVLTAVRSALTAAGIVAPVLIDSSSSAAVLASDLVFPLTSSSNTTWMQIVNALLAAISYRGIWVDWNGAFRGTPYVTPAAAAPEWRLAVGDLVTGIVASDRSAVQDLWGVPNWMRFIRNGLPFAPSEGAGQYTPENPSTGPSSQASVGRVVHAPVQFLDAVDQASLVSQGDLIFATAQRSTEVITCKLSPWPVAWHFDRAIYSDAALGTDRQVQCRSWSLPLDGSDMDYVIESL